MADKPRLPIRRYSFSAEEQERLLEDRRGRPGSSFSMACSLRSTEDGAIGPQMAVTAAVTGSDSIA